MLSKTTEYALRAVLHLAGAAGQPATAQVIARATSVPEGYLSKVLHTLARAGIVSSRRGPSGGFSLAVPPGELTMMQVVEAVEPLPRRGVGSEEGLLEETEGGGEGLGRLNEVLTELVRGVERRLTGTTIAALLGDVGEGGPGGR